MIERLHILYVCMPKKSWEEFAADVKHLTDSLGEWRPDIIVPAMRGGLIPAVLISEWIDIKDVRPISIDRIGEVRSIGYDVMGDVSGKSILLVEDDLPTGKGFMFTKKHLEQKGAVVKTAAVYVNEISRSLVDYFGSFQDPLPDLPWKPSRAGDRIVPII